MSATFTMLHKLFYLLLPEELCPRPLVRHGDHDPRLAAGGHRDLM